MKVYLDLNNPDMNDLNKNTLLILIKPFGDSSWPGSDFKKQIQCNIKTPNFVSHVGVCLCDNYLPSHYMGL